MDKTEVLIASCQIEDLNAKTKLPICNEWVVGRSAGDRSFPEDTSLSRKHFKIIPAQDVVLIQDLGSTNCTYVNGKKLKAKTLYRLRSRDIIAAGKQQFRVYIDGKLPENGHTSVKIEDPAVTSIFQRFTCPSESPSTMLAKTPQGKIENIEISQELSEDSKLINLAREGKGAWFLQFEGSEFGPITYEEIRRVVQNQHFQGGDLFVWEESLANWVKIDSSHKMFQLEAQNTNDEASENELSEEKTKENNWTARLVATVKCAYELEGKVSRINATCEEVSLKGIRILCDKFPDEVEVVALEILPLKSSGLSKFLAHAVRIAKEDMGQVVSLQFTEIAERDLSRLRKYLAGKNDAV